MLVVMAGLFSVDSVLIASQGSTWEQEVAAAVSRVAPPGTRLLSDVDLAQYLPVSSIGAEEMRARNERLAAKYSAVLPPVAEESRRNKEGGYIVRNYPFVMGGLGNVSPENLKIVLPFAWPLQSEEWQLDYWLERNYRMFVFQQAMLQHPVAAYRDFFQSIDRKCTKLATIPTKMAMFFETPCRFINAPDRAPHGGDDADAAIRRAELSNARLIPDPMAAATGRTVQLSQPSVRCFGFGPLWRDCSQPIGQRQNNPARK